MLDMNLVGITIMSVVALVICDIAMTVSRKKEEKFDKFKEELIKKIHE